MIISSYFHMNYVSGHRQNIINITKKYFWEGSEKEFMSTFIFKRWLLIQNKILLLLFSHTFTIHFLIINFCNFNVHILELPTVVANRCYYQFIYISEFYLHCSQGLVATFPKKLNWRYFFSFYLKLKVWIFDDTQYWFQTINLFGLKLWRKKLYKLLINISVYSVILRAVDFLFFFLSHLYS